MGPLLDELVRHIGEDTVAISTVPMFGDLVWDADMTSAEAQQLDPAVVIDVRATERRIVLQRIRGQIRYWLATDRRVEHLYQDAQTESGWVQTIDDALALCREHLFTSTNPGNLISRRWVRDQLRGGPR